MGVFDSIKLSVPIITVSDITIPVDYNDGTAVDPPAGIIFWSQKQVDDFLTDQSASNFKHLESVYAALPLIILHNITIQLAAGVHRPSLTPLNSFYSIFLAGKLFVGSGNIQIIGADPSNWEVISGLSALTIDSHTATGDPSIYVGTSNPGAFTGLDLRGYYAVLSTGQATPIIDNDNDNIFVVGALSPIPTNGVDTVSITRPSTIIRNSQDDTTAFQSGLLYIIGENTTGTSAGISIENVTIETFGCTSTLEVSNANLICTRWLFDHITYTQPPFNVTANGHGIALKGDCRATFDTCSFRAASGSGVDGSFAPGVNSDKVFIFVYTCFFMGGDRSDGFKVVGPGISMRIFGTIFDDHPVYIRERAEVDFFDTNFFGRYCQIQNVGNSVPALTMERGAHSLQLSSGINSRIVFKDNTGPCAKLRNARVDNSMTWIDGSGNLDVGIEIERVFSEVSLPAGTDVSGSVGDVRDADGSILSYATIQATGPLTAGLNFIEKA